MRGYLNITYLVLTVVVHVVHDAFWRHVNISEAGLFKMELVGVSMDNNVMLLL